MSTSVCWELTSDGLVSRPGGVKDSNPLNTTESGDKRRLHGPRTRLVKDLVVTERTSTFVKIKLENLTILKIFTHISA